MIKLNDHDQLLSVANTLIAQHNYEELGKLCEENEFTAYYFDSASSQVYLAKFAPLFIDDCLYIVEKYADAFGWLTCDELFENEQECTLFATADIYKVIQSLHQAIEQLSKVNDISEEEC